MECFVECGGTPQISHPKVAVAGPQHKLHCTLSRHLETKSLLRPLPFILLYYCLLPFAMQIRVLCDDASFWFLADQWLSWSPSDTENAAGDMYASECLLQARDTESERPFDVCIHTESVEGALDGIKHGTERRCGECGSRGE